MICSRCGKEFVSGSAFCDFCGHPVGLAPSAPTTAPMPQAPIQQPYPPRPVQAPVPQAVPQPQFQNVAPQAPVQQPVRQVPYQYPSSPYPPMMQQPVQPNAPYYPPYPMAAQMPGAVRPRKKKAGSIVALLATIASLIFLVIMLTLPVIAPSWGRVTKSISNNCGTWIAFFWISAVLVLIAWVFIIVTLSTRNCNPITIVAIVFASIALLLFLIDIPFYSKINDNYKAGKQVERYYDDLSDYLS